MVAGVLPERGDAVSHEAPLAVAKATLPPAGLGI
jgi:hypothetical protein